MPFKLINYHSLILLFFLILNGCSNQPVKKNEHFFANQAYESREYVKNNSIIDRGVGTLHSILVVDENDPNIGAGQDRAAIQKLTSTIRRATCLGGEDIVITVSRGKRNAIKSQLNNLSVSSNDVVFFYYSGHGTNPGNRDRWPALAVEGQGGGNLLKLSSVKKTLQSKKPRLLITVADACNDIAGARSADRGKKQTDQPAGFKKLFLGYSGTIVASSSIPGQYSFGDPQNGGLFTNQFLESLNQVQASTNPNWEIIKTEAIKVISVDHPEQNKQKPQLKLNVTQVGGRRDNSNVWSCPTGQVPGRVNRNGPNITPSPSNYPSCGDGLKRKLGTNEECCYGGGTLHCFID